MKNTKHVIIGTLLVVVGLKRIIEEQTGENLGNYTLPVLLIILGTLLFINSQKPSKQ